MNTENASTDNGKLHLQNVISRLFELERFDIDPQWNGEFTELEKRVESTGEYVSWRSVRELLYFKMNLLQAEIAMNGMIAENKLRESCGDSPVYVEKDFLDLITKYGIYHNQFPMIGGE